MVSHEMMVRHEAICCDELMSLLGMPAANDDCLLLLLDALMTAAPCLEKCVTMLQAPCL